MKLALAAVCLLLALCLTLVVTKWQGVIAVATPKHKMQQNMDEIVDAKARQAQNGDENSIRALADAIFDNFVPGLPADTSAVIKDRLVRAEIKHRKGHQGVKESSIVKAVNHLANALGAPDYAQTSPLQIRVLRADLSETIPSLISPEDEKDKGARKKVGHSLKRELSPLEATVVMAMMIQQKMLNPDWQLTPQEYAQSLSNKRDKNKPAANAGGGRKEYRLVPDDRDRRKSREMATLVGSKVKKLSIASVTMLVHDSLDALGVER